MKLGRYFLLTCLFWILSAPWWFAAKEPQQAEGDLPFWVVYCLGVAVAYAVFVATSLRRVWREDADS